ncbi:hypothetical protein Pcinc_023890 [Petrolisthes cinctipes]|uniref:Uncharacterized protein n=1 Tax=Petrolisthes cinctipes TaxID=88211 RepID=A0AAE1FCJ4_PETCI|nr:hypothetical protein Pcinc_023890 [Petrolisthes cinctipes]
MKVDSDSADVNKVWFFVLLVFCYDFANADKVAGTAITTNSTPPNHPHRYNYTTTTPPSPTQPPNHPHHHNYTTTTPPPPLHHHHPNHQTTHITTTTLQLHHHHLKTTTTTLTTKTTGTPPIHQHTSLSVSDE